MPVCVSCCHSPNLIYQFTHREIDIFSAISLSWSCSYISSGNHKRLQYIFQSQKKSDSQGLGRANQTRRAGEPDTGSTGRPDTQLPWHLEEKAFWSGRQNRSVFVFQSLCFHKSVHSCLSPSASRCMSVLVSVIFIIFYSFLSLFPFLAFPTSILRSHFLCFCVLKIVPVCVLHISVFHCCRR